MKRWNMFVLVILPCLCACASSPIPEGYDGPLAHIMDSVANSAASKADIFYLSSVNGRRIENSLSSTEMRNYGRGFEMTPIVVGRDVPAQSATFEIVGRTHYAAPILALTNTVYEVTGDVSFAPLDGRTYVVTGSLGEVYSAVWIEDSESGELIGERIVIEGSSALGFFEK